MQRNTAITTFLFTDVEGSTRLWDEAPDRMRRALARHDALVRAEIEAHGGSVVKMTGDGVHAAFDDPLDALVASLALQRSLADPASTDGTPLAIRCGVHLGAVERRDNDYFGTPVNRTARLMAAAHGGQILVSQAVASEVERRLPTQVSLRDLGVVRLRDLAHAEHVYQVQHPALRRDFPALRSLEATPNNLPQQLTSFVGRERELHDVRALLTATRLLTVLGVGGLGKTRLTLELAVDLLDEYPDGVWVVELAPLSDPRLVPQAAATVLGVKEEPSRPIVEALVKFGMERRCLLILDNCEHLIEACADLASTLLRATPQLKILASSREPLNIAGETTYSLPPLAAPDARRPGPPETLTDFDSVRLFVDRAVAAQPNFRVVDANAAAVAEICSRLDGIPLALELAAARVRTLSAERIAERLSDRFRLLTGGARSALPRQQTLRALIDWSYDLLSAPEQTLLQRLSVFAGTFLIEAAEAVGGEGAEERTKVLDLLTRLVEKSLVIVEADADRYRLLDTVRQYAHDRLDEAGAVGDARTRHLAVYLAFADAARPNLVGPQQAAWLARLDAERENLLAAHAWCAHAVDGGASGLKLANDVKQYWVSRGHLGLRHRLTVEALDHPQAQRRDLARCRGLFNAGQVCCFMGRHDEANGYLVESLAIARELADATRIAAVLQLLGLASLGRGDVGAARGYLEEALALARAQGNQREIAAAVNGLAQFHRVIGALDAAEPLYEEVLGLARDMDDREIVAIVELNLAMVAVSRGDDARARQLLHHALAAARDVGSRPVGQSTIEVTAGRAAACGRWQCAARLYGAAEAQAAQTGLRRDPADEAFLVPLVERARAALGPQRFAEAESAGRRLDYDAAIVEVEDALRQLVWCPARRGADADAAGVHGGYS